jgi:hypothetical protein
MKREKLIRLLMASKIARSQRRVEALCRAGDKAANPQREKKSAR